MDFSSIFFSASSIRSKLVFYLFCFLIFYHVVFSSLFSMRRQRRLFFIYFFALLSLSFSSLYKLVELWTSWRVPKSAQFNKKNFSTFNNCLWSPLSKKLLFFSFCLFTFMLVRKTFITQETYNFRLVVVIQKCQRTAKSSQKIS